MRFANCAGPRIGLGFLCLTFYCVALFGHFVVVTGGQEPSNSTDGELDSTPIAEEGHDSFKGKDTVSIKEYLTYIVQPEPPMEEEEGPLIAAPSAEEALITSEPHTPLLNESDLSVGDLLSMPIDHITDVDQQLLPVSEILIPPEIVDPVQVESPSAPVSVVAIESKEQIQAAPTNDTVPSVSLNASRTNDSGANEADDIPSFNEWTQKVLAEEEKSGANGNASVATPVKQSSSPKLRQKNYASPDCGAKILTANAEAEHTSAVLDPARDEYFLSICSAKIWFVIELCEAIQAQRVEIANFELFSSSPKDFRVYISDRYPTRDWALLGQFTASDERSIQNFPVQQRLFGKFIRVELVSHYGKEHFCPMSLFRVYGNSEYEVLDIEDSRGGVSGDGGEEDSTEEEMLDDVNKSTVNVDGSRAAVPTGADAGRNLFGSAKEAVINIVKKAAEVLTKSPTPVLEATVESNETSQVKDQDLRRTCHSTSAEHVNVSQAINESLSCQWAELDFLSSQAWLRQTLFEQCNAEMSDQCYSSPELAFAKSIWTAPTVNALCYWILPEEKKPCNTKSSTPLPLEIPILLVPIEKPIIQLEVTPVEIDPTTTTSTSTTTTTTDLLSNGSVELVDIEHFEHLFNEAMEVDYVPSGMDAVKLVESILATEQPSSKPPPNNVPPHQQQQLKESVFVRLSNRIKVLERNMSLSGQYLEELSRRYKRQVDDMQKSLNRTLQTLNETMHRMSSQEERYQSTLNQLHSDISELKSSTQRLNEENFTLRAQMIEQHLLLMILEVVIVSLLVVFLLRRYLDRPRPRRSVGTPPPSHQPAVEQQQTEPTRLKVSDKNFRLEVGQKVEEVKVKQSSTSALTLQVTHGAKPTKQQQASPTPSLADSSSSGCESAFSFPNSINAPSRDPSPISLVHEKIRLGEPVFKNGGKKNNKHKKKNHQTSGNNKIPPFYHSKSEPNASSKIRLERDFPDSRAKILAAEFIKEYYDNNKMRSSL